MSTASRPYMSSSKSTRSLSLSVFILCLCAILHSSAVHCEDPLPAAGEQESPTATSEPTPTPFPTLTPESLQDLKVTVPDGLRGRLAFGIEIGNYERILILDFESQAVTALIDGPGSSSYPSWNPDGTMLSFTSTRDGNREIYVADWDGANQRRVTHSPREDDHSSWAPDGKRLVFDSELSQNTSTIFSINIDGSEQIQIGSKSGRNTIPRWSPDGRFISYSTSRFWPGWDVCLWDLERQSESCPLGGRESYCRAEWSHSGNFLAFSSGVGNEINLGLLEIKNQRTSALPALPGREYDACWSPTDSHIAFAAENGPANGIFNLYIVNVAADKASQIIRSPYPIRYLSWTKSSTLELEAHRVSQQQKQSRRAAGPAEPSVAASPTAPNKDQRLINPIDLPTPEPTRYVPPYLRDSGSWEGK